FEKIFKESDGILFFGGADIPPALYGEKTELLSTVTTTVRSFLETSFVFHLLGGSQNLAQPALLETDYDFPVLGICLGCQTLNVGTGGSLVQDIPSDVYGLKHYEDVAALGREHWHTNPWARVHPEKNLLSYNLHPILLQNEGKFVQEMGMTASDTPTIMSAHHQMAGRIGLGLKVIATSMDGRVPWSMNASPPS
ncbi:MAG: gamma-glutamyl-gamma-aminobutyrate hydrolase family protein, partial [Candidatus Aminicenantes bacterium]|nr:gamma-glutamyl-gamma-aminobutyrate hydrolase family protein [Candidatus Aminicenantes bacterium]